MRTLLLTSLLCASALSSATLIEVNVASSRSSDRTAAADAAVRKFGRAAASLTRKERARGSLQGQFSLPASVIFKGGGSPTRGRDNDITLQFDTSGNGAFPTEYRALLESVYASVKPRLDAVFGNPFTGGTVRVVNYDADIGERDAVAGGYFLYDPAATVPAQIRFPIYADGVGIKAETVAVNFVHCLLLSYMGNRTLPNDAWREGLVRAATMNICRSAGALPSSLDASAIEQVLASTYDLGPTYEINNQKGLICRDFIAPNLRSVNLPIGGSTGGLYLVRYQMAGTALQKVLIEYPTFARELLARYYVAPAASLETLGQQAVDAAAGLSNSTVEGQSWAAWSRAQYILQSTLAPGFRLMVKAFPITGGLSGNDFGVFAFEAHTFKVDKLGNETLGTDTIYPIYWGTDFSRVFASAQDDRIDVIQGYGSVVPNFGDAFGGQPYRVAVDMGAQDENVRLYAPAGAVATASNPTPKNVYGTVTGIEGIAGATFDVRITWAGGTITTPVQNFAFGNQIGIGNWTSTQRRVAVELLQTSQGVTTAILTRMINKSPGPLQLDLKYNSFGQLGVGTFSPGLNLIGLSGEPQAPTATDQFGAGALIARWNAGIGKYDLAPSTGVTRAGQAYYARLDNTLTLNYLGTAEESVPVSVKVRPGWNLIANPTDHTVTLSNLQVVVASGFPRTYADAIAATVIGPQMFQFIQGAADPASGVPESGSLLPVTVLAPGQAAFVRILAPEGATLVFPPFGANREQAMRPNDLYRLNLAGGGEHSFGEIGLSRTATSGWDKAEDSELPPALGGLQVSMANSRRYVREMRRLGQTQIYSVTLENLRVGTEYELSLAGTSARAIRVFIGAKGGPRLNLGQTYKFVATTKSKRIRVMVSK